MDAQREKRIRWAVDACITRLIEAQTTASVPHDRARARVLATLRQHGARLLRPPPQLFQALELPDELAERHVAVPVPTAAGGEFVIAVRVTLVDTAYYERWHCSLLGAEPSTGGPELRALGERVKELVEATRIRREAEARAAPPLPPTPASPSHGSEGDAVRRAAESLASGDEGVLEELLAGMAPSVRLHQADATKRRSRFGGVPFLPRSHDWPRRSCSRPPHFLTQLDMREVPRTPITRPLPAAGMLAFFYDGEEMPWGIESSDADAFKVLFHPPGVELAPTQPPADTPEDFVRPAAGIRSALDATVDVDALALDSTQQDAIDERLADEPAHRLLGVPEAIQEDPRKGVVPDAGADDWRLLLQLDSGEPLGFDYGDNGRIYFLMRSSDLAEHRWERGWVVLQCY